METDPKYVNASVELTNIKNISFVSIFINQTVIADRQMKVSYELSSLYQDENHHIDKFRPWSNFTSWKMANMNNFSLI
jgi:hypothetical protein